MILVGGRMLMSTSLTASELALAERGCAAISTVRKPRVLIGGLGLGLTLRAALDALGPKATVTVAELNSKVVEWNQGPVAIVNNRAALDPRVRFFVGDVTDHIAQVSGDPGAPRYDAILWDLYVGPERRGGDADPLFGHASIRSTATALAAGGVFGVWGETPSPAFEGRLRTHGFDVALVRTRGRGLRHAVYMATKRVARTGR